MATLNRLPVRAVLAALLDYLLVIVPVGFYVGLEALHKKEATFFLVSPEWAIATVFLSFQGAHLYLRNLIESGRKPNWTVGFLILLGVVVVTSGSIINAFMSLSDNNTLLIVVRLILFFLSTLFFLLFVAGASYVRLESEEDHNAK